MKKIVLLLSVLLIVGVFSAMVLAQPQTQAPTSQGWPMGRMYNPKTVESLEGKIESLETVTASRMDIPARVLLKLKTNQETVTVYLGPKWYLEKQKAKLSPGDYLQVKGSRVTMDNQPVILPNTITKGSEVMQFWDEQGSPIWRGQGMGRGRGMGVKQQENVPKH
jgi:hypothetical protein